MSQPNTLNASDISCCVIQTGTVGIVTAPFSLIVIIRISPKTIALKKPRGLTLTDTHENMFL